MCVWYLFSSLDASAGADDNLVLLLHSHHLRDAVWRTRVVDVPVNHQQRAGSITCDEYNEDINRAEPV